MLSKTEASERVDLRMTPQQIAAARIIGGGNLSRGIRIAVEAYIEDKTSREVING